MAYAAGFEYDVFVSYAAVDDMEPVGDNGRGWVSLFVQNLEIVLASRLGGREKLRIYFDRRNLGGNHHLEELVDAVQKSAIFIAITSPAYSQREWTRRELETFLKCSPDSRRLFAIEYLPLDPGEQYPPPLEERSRMKFWDVDDVSSLAAMPLTTKDHAFRSRIHDAADQIKRQLVAINAAEVTRPAISQAAEVIADDSARRSKGIIYLAQTTDDLDEDRSQVRRYLEQFGFLILPAGDLPGGGDAFRAAAEIDIRQADLYVHLLGARAGRYPADLPDGYGATQLNAARAANKPVILWRHPELDLSAITDTRQRALLTDANVVACGLESFKAEVRRRLETKPKAEAKAKAAPSLVFIDASELDNDVANIVRQEFEQRQMSVAIPLYTGSAEEVREDLTENMKDCDVLVFIYGRAPPAWVRAQMRLFSKLRPGTKAKLVAIFVGPPDEKPDDIGFSLPDLRRVDFHEQWSVDRIREMIEGIAL
jgi:hypothetical protein